MKSLFIRIVAGCVVLGCASVTFAGFSVSGAANGVAIPNNNNYKSNLTSLFGSNAGIYTASDITVTQTGTLEFYYHGSESGYQDFFEIKGGDANGGTTQYEANPSQTTEPWVNPGTPFATYQVSAGDSLKNDFQLAFGSNSGLAAVLGELGFGVFASRDGSGNLTSFLASDGRLYFGYDDQPTNADDNHDDFIVSVAFVPEPMSVFVWLGLAATLGVVVHRRRKAQR